MTSNKKSFIQIYNKYKWFIWLAGIIVIIVFSIFNYYTTIPSIEWTGYLHERNGFLFGTSEIIQWNKSQISIQFKSLDLEKRQATVTVIASTFLQNRTEYEDGYFVLQIPYDITNVDVEVLAYNPEDHGGYVEVNNETKGLTFIIVRVPKEENKIIFEKTHHTINFTFTIIDAFWRHEHYKYEVQSTFAISFHETLDDIDDLKDVIEYFRYPDGRLLYFNLFYSRFDLEAPELGYDVMNFIPQPNLIYYNEGRQWYRWNITAISSAIMPSSSVKIIVENRQTRINDSIFTTVLWTMGGIFVAKLIDDLPTLSNLRKDE